MTDIRRASSADGGAMAELRWEFRAGRQPPTETHATFIKRCAAWMRRELTTVNAWQAWVAVNSGVIVGQVWLHTIPKIPNPITEAERHAYLSNLYVKPSDRGGTGTRLLEAAIAGARGDGVDRVVLWPSGRSVTLYLRYGFSHGGDVMELKVRS
jgi:N-acetylglutamate synthase-like GNAT family acetyltransferase